MDNYLFFIAWTSIGIQLMVPVAMASFGELISEKSGVLNIGIEGCMLIGAFSTAFIGIVYGSIFLGIMAGILSGFICGVILGIIFIWRNMDQIVSGLMFNLFAFGLTGTLHSSFLSGQMGPTLSSFGFVGSDQFSSMSRASRPPTGRNFESVWACTMGLARSEQC